MLPALTIAYEPYLGISPHHPKHEPFKVEFQSDNDTLIIKGNFNSEESLQALSQCGHLIANHLKNHKEVHLYVYLKKYDLSNLHSWTSTMDRLEESSQKIHINWFMNSTDQKSYKIVNEVLHSYQVRTIDII
jgi:hypothetical protein